MDSPNLWVNPIYLESDEDASISENQDPFLLSYSSVNSQIAGRQTEEGQTLGQMPTPISMPNYPMVPGAAIDVSGINSDSNGEGSHFNLPNNQGDDNGSDNYEYNLEDQIMCDHHRMEEVEPVGIMAPRGTLSHRSALR